MALLVNLRISLSLGAALVPVDLLTRSIICFSSVDTVRLIAFDRSGLGSNATQGNLNDLWTFDTRSRRWMWVSGADSIDSFPSYTADGVPGGRLDPMCWIGRNDSFWVFGGNGERFAGK